MKQKFDLSLWLQDKSRKIVTRNGRPVRIVCWDKLGDYPIIGCIKYSDDYENFESYNINGSKYSFNREDQNDLFFADEEEKEELSEFEKELEMMIVSFSNGNLGSDVIKEMPKQKLHDYSHRLLDLARKELQPDVD